MDDLIFGTLSTDPLKLIHYRAARRGIHHAYRIEPPDPRPGQPIQIIAFTGPDLPADQAACYWTVDGTDPKGACGQAAHGNVVPLVRVGATWDLLLWGYVARWEASLPPLEDGTTVRYRIGAWRSGGPGVFADWPDVYATTEAAARAHFQKEPVREQTLGTPAPGTLFLLRSDHLQPPGWAVESVVYQIFVDRFHPGPRRRWRQTTDLRAFCGGTLWGVAEQLDYVAALGATCIWLSPIFPSPTTHGYDATDLQRVEDRLGGDESLRQVVRRAHGLGIRVVLDFVCNHLSDRHPVFAEARRNPDSPQRAWFTFDDSPIGYRTYFGVASMPQVNLEHPGARRWMIDAARYWLREFEVDGYRLDHATGPGPGFWTDFYAACKQEKPDCFLFGELVEPPDIQRQYLGRMDGALDFHTASALRDGFARRKIPEAMFEAFLVDHLAQFPAPFLLPTFLDNHDMDRFLYVAGGAKDRLRRAVQAQMRLPGPPVIFYGSEVGLQQTHAKASTVGWEASRVPMVWDERQDRELFEFYRRAIRQRAAEKPWRHQQ